MFHGLSALAIGASERVSSTAAGAPTPERNWNGSMIETVPWYRPTCGVSLSASLIWSFSPGSSLPIWPVSVEYRTVPSGEYIVTLSKSLGSVTTVLICDESSVARVLLTGAVRSLGVNSNDSELSAIARACETTMSSALRFARTPISRDPMIPMISSPPRTPSRIRAMRL